MNVEQKNSTQPSNPTAATLTSVTTTTTTPVISGNASSSSTQRHFVHSTTRNTSTSPTNSLFTLPGGTQDPAGVPYIAPLPPCLMPEYLTRKSYFEEYLQNCSVSALLRLILERTQKRTTLFCLAIERKSFALLHHVLFITTNHLRCSFVLFDAFARITQLMTKF